MKGVGIPPKVSRSSTLVVNKLEDEGQDSVVLTVSRVCKLVSVAVGTVGVRPFTAASSRI